MANKNLRPWLVEPIAIIIIGSLIGNSLKFIAQLTLASFEALVKKIEIITRIKSPQLRGDKESRERQILPGVSIR